MIGGELGSSSCNYKLIWVFENIRNEFIRGMSSSQISETSDMEIQ